MTIESSYDTESNQNTNRSLGRLKFDKETAKRRQEIFDLINKRRQVSRHGIQTNKQNSYHAIVREE